ncbi:hypothetical protein WJ438_34975 [Streptomyces sp. GD-15H]|uniref:hypothetical protein n=1 Tax=Streptomyces sp. GD-15H TaxID=3129112 RepID=UPI00324E081C
MTKGTAREISLSYGMPQPASCPVRWRARWAPRLVLLCCPCFFQDFASSEAEAVSHFSHDPMVVASCHGL